MNPTQPPTHLEKAAATRRTKERIDEFEFLLASGVDPESAARRAGWPTLEAAEICLRRTGHPRPRDLNSLARRRRARTERRKAA